MLTKTQIAESLFSSNSGVSTDVAKEILSRIQDEFVSIEAPEPVRIFDHKRGKIWEALGYSKDELQEMYKNAMETFTNLSSTSYQVEELMKMNKYDLAVFAAITAGKLTSGQGDILGALLRMRRHDDNDHDGE